MLRGRNSSVGSAWARCPQRRGFDPPLGTFSGRGDFSLGVNMGSNSIPPKTLSDESINRGLVCAHTHFIARTQILIVNVFYIFEYFSAQTQKNNLAVIYNKVRMKNCKEILLTHMTEVMK